MAVKYSEILKLNKELENNLKSSSYSITVLSNIIVQQSKEILEYDGPILVDIKVVPDENCYPMVAPGKSNAQMMGV